ncbi:glycosyltransferase family 1 protein [Bacillus mobilis]|uniref:glycosyltransferase family 1 protein n=1 Tax=Bacillus mobilis TaxID=2026190 RepID=UPI003CFDF0AF
MLKVLYVGMSSDLGGIEAFVMNYYRNIDRNKIQIDFLKFEEHICFEEEIVSGGGNVYQLPPRKSGLKYYYSLFKFFKAHTDYSYVHIHLNTCSSIAPVVIAKLFGAKIIAHSHNEWKGNSKITKFLHYINKPILSKISNYKFACSNVAGKWLFKESDEYIIVKNSIGAESYIYNMKVRKEKRKELDVCGDFVLGHIGRFTYQKNHEFLLEVFKAIYDKNKDVKLLLVGTGELREGLEKRVLSMGLENNVIFTGIRADISELLQAMDVFVFPSHFEGLGIVVVEAQAAGLQCIVSDSIPKEAFVTELIKEVSLKQNKDIWATEILKLNNRYERTNTYEEISEAGYDIKSSALWLEKFYINN